MTIPTHQRSTGNQQGRGVMRKSLVFDMRMSSEDMDRLLVIAEHYELSAAAVIRMLVKRDHELLGRTK